MQNSLKIGISIPKEDFERIEALRYKMKIGQSALIDKAIRFWLEWIEHEDLIKQYEEGYRKKPEPIQEIEAMEKAAAEVFQEEDVC